MAIDPGLAAILAQLAAGGGTGTAQSTPTPTTPVPQTGSSGSGGPFSFAQAFQALLPYLSMFMQQGGLGGNLGQAAGQLETNPASIGVNLTPPPANNPNYNQAQVTPQAAPSGISSALAPQGNQVLWSPQQGEYIQQIPGNPGADLSLATAYNQSVRPGGSNA